MRNVTLMLPLVILVLVTASCSSNGVPVYETQGTVNFKGKPAEGAVVVFHPKSGDEELKKLRPFGRVAADGSYQLTTFEANDGAPAGEYNVSIEWMQAVRRNIEQRDEDDPTDARRELPSVDKLKGRYADSVESGLTATVKEGSNAIPAFELK